MTSLKDSLSYGQTSSLLSLGKIMKLLLTKNEYKWLFLM